MTPAFPWQRLFRLGLLNGLPPDHIWQMTAGEVHKLLSRQTDQPVSADILAALMQQAASDKPSAEPRKNGAAPW